MANYIRFDWAMKRLLRNKANYAVLEGFMCSLLNENFKINRFLDSESNQQTENDKFNRVDILAENEKGEFIIFEIQNTREHAYFHRMLYGVSKVITDNISLGDDYDKVRKVYSINIVYFTLGQAKDYVYHGKTMFQGLHQPDDILKLSNRQSELFFGDEISQGRKTNREAGDIFPEYYLLCVNNFDKLAVNNLDEWIEFLKTGEISEAAQAPGLADARKCLDIDKLTVAEKNDYAVTWRICAISAALSRRDMMMAGRKVVPRVVLRVVPRVVLREPKMRRRPQPVAYLQWACLLIKLLRQLS